MVVITYGTFDLLHYGHLKLLKRASQLGDKLIVGVSSDDCCENKGKRCVFTCEERMEMISDLKYVDFVIPEFNMHQKIDDIKKYNVDIFVLGSDYEHIFPKMEEYEQVKNLTKIIYLPRTPNISTSLLKKTCEDIC